MILLTTYREKEKFLVDELEENFTNLMPKGRFISKQTDNKSKAILDTILNHKDSVFYLDNHAVIQSEIKMTQMRTSMALYFQDGVLNTSSMIFLNQQPSIDFLKTWGDTAEGLKKAINSYPFDTLPFNLCCPKVSKECRLPIIIFNKERRYVEPKNANIPNTIGRSRIMKGNNGSVSISRRDPVAEDYLDKILKRLPNQLVWVPK